ncbi:MAG TPA: ABC transporter ATP-binding protein [Candidatus Limnocylindrales bacterium]|nr:ABC transporter ATP-binding protein [Candidatus Limnocylindrales bacterium]
MRARRANFALVLVARVRDTAIEMIAIQVDGLRKSFGDIVAVDGVTFEVRPGETFGLLGPNGAGKTTTISMIVGALPPDAGKVRLAGHEDPTRPAVRLRVGVAPQALALYTELTGEENLEFFGRLYGLKGEHLKERMEWALKFSGLLDRRKDRVHGYSGGMQRRLNLVCGLLHNPPIVVLDEPTVGVDPQSRNLLFENIEELKAQGRTILYTTHYMEEAERLCDRVAILDRGKLLALDSVSNLVRQHGGLPTVEIEFEDRPSGLEALGGAWDKGRWRVQSDKPVQVLERAGAAGQFANVSIRRANLEAVFLGLTGRSLRD